MPHTVPNRPTNGAVEPTVANTAKPSCARFWMLSTARCRPMPTQVVRSMLACMAATFVRLTGLHALLGDVAEGAAGLQLVHARLHVACGPEVFGGGLGAAQQFALLKQLREDDVPAGHRHDDHDDQRATGHPVALFPEGFQAVRVGDRLFFDHGLGWCCGHCWGRRGGRHRHRGGLRRRWGRRLRHGRRGHSAHQGDHQRGGRCCKVQAGGLEKRHRTSGGMNGG